MRSLLTSSYLTLALAALVLLTGCRKTRSEREPIQLQQNMYYDESFGPQEANSFFENRMADRPPVAGAVARGHLKEDSRFYTGRDEDGNLIDRIPIPVTRELLERGQDRYNIYCAVCHGQAGDGQGIIMTGDYGYTPAPTYHSSRLRDEVGDGYMYDVVANGVRSMPGYAQQISVSDRWAIVGYLRALQRSQFTEEGDLPASAIREIEQGRSANIQGGRIGEE
ncbi:MAG: c-type cytochrome [Bacteroidetes bacterium]|jgi:mono/diheme cytochrome c family protein|nr:c-type cytochrome [Bacteroidota bacterium]